MIMPVLILFLLTGCGNNVQKKVEKLEVIPISTIDLSATYPQMDNGYDCELEYIPLETNDKVLIAGRNHLSYVSEEKIIITNTNLGDIFVFDSKGKALSHFNHRGRGPEEYADTRRVKYDSKRSEIFAFGRNSAVVYSEQGEYKRHLNYGNLIVFSQDIFNFDDESFLVHIENNEKVDSSFAFISKNEGEILSFVKLPSEDAIATTRVDKNRNTIGYITSQQLFKDGEGFILSPISIDTIYHLTKEKQLIPLLTRTPSVHNSDPPSVLMPMIVTDKFLLLIQFVINLDANSPGIENKQFVYDREERKFYGRFNWNCPVIYAGFIFTHSDMHHNWHAFLPDVYAIKKRVDDSSEEVDDKLKELAKTLDDDDNPVLEIMKFK
jgi:hypothetical protein